MSALGELEVTLGIGSQKINWNVFVGQIQDSLLLGLDAMQAAEVTIVAGQQVFVGIDPVPSQVVGGYGEEISVARVPKEKTSHSAQHGQKTSQNQQAQILTQLEKKDIHHDRLKHPVRPPEHFPDVPQPCQPDWTLLQTDCPKNCPMPPKRKPLRG